MGGATPVEKLPSADDEPRNGETERHRDDDTAGRPNDSIHDGTGDRMNSGRDDGAETETDDSVDSTDDERAGVNAASRQSSSDEKSAHAAARRYSHGEADHGEPDINHELVEATTLGHELDVELGMARDPSDLERIETRGSLRYKLSRTRTWTQRSRGGEGAADDRGDDHDNDDNDNPHSDAETPKSGLAREPLPLTDLAAGIVGWDAQDDPAMPLNRPARQRWVHIATLAAVTFLTTFASSILAPGMDAVDAAFGNTDAMVSSIAVSVYLLGYVVGPLFMGPLSEIYGRRPVLALAGIFFCAWQLAVALAPNMAALVVFRFLGGVGGAGCMTLGGSVVGDLFRADQRGLAMGAWNLGPLFGPTMGPLIGGFVASDIGWRWDFWIVLILALVLSVALHIVGPESNARVLMQRKVLRLRRELGRDDLRSCYDSGSNSAAASKSRILLNGLQRPTKMLLLSPMIFSLSLYMAFVYGVMYLLFTTIPTVFSETYGFGVGVSGLVYLSLGVSNVTGWLVITLWSDASVIRLTRARGGRFVPEMRLATTIGFGAFLPVTFFWYGWAVEARTHWIVPVLGLMPFGFGMMGLMIPIVTYLVDAYPLYAASALAANVVLRSLVGALLPMAGPSLYGRLGYGWGNSVLGFISIGMVPVPLLIYRYGEAMRKAQHFTL